MSEDGKDVAKAQRQPPDPIPPPAVRIGHYQVHQSFDTDVAGCQAAIHIGLAEFQVRLCHKTTQCSRVMYRDFGHRAAVRRAKLRLPAAWRGDGQLPGLDELSQDSQNESLKHGAHISVYCG